MQTPHPVQSPYEGPHPQIDKILHMHNCYTKTSNEYKIKVEYIAGTRQINISRALQQVHSQGLKIQNSQVFFQNIDLKMYMYLGTFPFQNSVYLKYQYCLDPIIKLKYKKISQSPKSTPTPTPQYSKSSQSQVQNSKATRSRPKQRTVGQVLETVKNWKQLIAQLDHTGHKIHTLTSAAEVIGICKKTLEDYACQVQFGYEFNFDFQKNMHQKIGFLRKFVKAKRKELAILNNTDNYWNFQASNSNSSDDDKGNAR